jgi:hypothetical protein
MERSTVHIAMHSKIITIARSIDYLILPFSDFKTMNNRQVEYTILHGKFGAPEADVVRCDSIIQYDKTITLLCFKKPPAPPATILCGFEQKLSFMTSVGSLSREILKPFHWG